MKPTVILMRGLPGVGKSQYIKDHFDNAKIFSADDYPGRYDKPIDKAKLAAAHPWCFRRMIIYFQSHCREKRHGGNILIKNNFDNDIIIDNTNISAWECSPYIMAASAHGLEHKIITLWTDHPVNGAWVRNKHDVPLRVVVQMYQRLCAEQLPSFWNHEIIKAAL